jgi:hypothetical protein
MTPDAAETLALQALGHIAADSDRLDRFVALTGLDGTAIRERANDPAFLGGILDHLLADEALLIEFCAEADVPPQRIASARSLLPGATPEW